MKSSDLVHVHPWEPGACQGHAGATAGTPLGCVLASPPAPSIQGVSGSHRQIVGVTPAQAPFTQRAPRPRSSQPPGRDPNTHPTELTSPSGQPLSSARLVVTAAPSRGLASLVPAENPTERSKPCPAPTAPSGPSAWPLPPWGPSQQAVPRAPQPGHLLLQVLAAGPLLCTALPGA